MNVKTAETEIQFLSLHQALIDGCRKGDQKAQFQIYKLYYKAMYNISLRIVKDTMEAEDIMQEAFLSAFEKIETYSGRVSFGSWLKKIVQNRSLDYLSKKRLILCKEIEAYHDIKDSISLQNEEPDPRIKKIMEKIKLLPLKYQNILLLYKFEGYDHEEIAQILSIPSSTSRSHFLRARHILRAEMD
jgi:RNA polymerase sigma factor (sigma-70 family)